MTQSTLFTKDGYQKIKDELALLEQKKEHLVTQVEEVAQPDESGQDGLAQQLKEELELVLEKIDKLQTALNGSKILNQKKGNCQTVELGSQVKIKLTDQNEQVFQIVDNLEADPSQNKISHQSPIGQALLGKKINDQIEVDAPVGKITYKIISIN